MDESGVHDGSPVLTVGTYIGRPRQWRDFTKDWNRLKRPIKIFHATDCAALRGEFKGWSDDERNALVAQLLPAIPRSEVVGIVIGIVMNDFHDAMKEHPDLRKLFGNPYTACFQWTVQTILKIMHDRGVRQRIAFFHENNNFQGDALASFKWVKENMNPNNVVMSLTFGSKEDYVPLQAADVLAYEGNKRLRNVETAERRAFTVLNPTRHRLLVKFYSKKSMPGFINILQRVKDGRPVDKFGDFFKTRIFI
jgi:hypothetical protein